MRNGERQDRIRAQLSDNRLDVTLNGHRQSVYGHRHGQELTLFQQGRNFRCTLFRETFGLEDTSLEGSLEASMSGAVISVQVKKGDTVIAGQTLLIMEAMKMEHTIKASANGVVSEVLYGVCDQVAKGAELIAIDVTPGADTEETEAKA